MMVTVERPEHKPSLAAGPNGDHLVGHLNGEGYIPRPVTETKTIGGLVPYYSNDKTGVREIRLERQ